MSSRRKFIQKAAIGGALLTLPNVSFSSTPEQPMIHQVFFWLNEEVTIQEFIQEAKKLASIQTVRKFYIGTPAETVSRDVIDSSYSIACTFFFDSVSDEQEYQVDPMHLAFVEENKNKWHKVVVYDFVI
ncbi:Dabb family protein [Mongoliitalea daihaiensis]|uniref:Dabb family protein n=1 Tax=Mongoliitalea daihaiensis TaxID=2782006 RepID=UPI001F3F3D4E|nr:Dabb family protein [Mongoliitalea daihaiensis]UJP63528.1 Dabb family protein [Mongoliitalea daihaiensis]